MRKRAEGHVLTDPIPTPPTREQELAYLDWFAQDIYEDPWTDIRFTKHQCGPLRVPYKRVKQVNDKYVSEFYSKALFGGLISVPLAIWMGRRAQVNETGVPRTHKNIQLLHPNPSPHYVSRRNFKIGFWCTVIGVGYVFASVTTIPPYEQLKDPDYQNKLWR